MCSSDLSGGGWTLVAEIFSGSSSHHVSNEVNVTGLANRQNGKLSDGLINAISKTEFKLNCGGKIGYVSGNCSFDADVAANGSCLISPAHYSSAYHGVNAYNGGSTPIYWHSGYHGCYGVTGNNSGNLWVK